MKSILWRHLGTTQEDKTYFWNFVMFSEVISIAGRLHFRLGNPVKRVKVVGLGNKSMSRKSVGENDESEI